MSVYLKRLPYGNCGIHRIRLIDDPAAASRIKQSRRARRWKSLGTTNTDLSIPPDLQARMERELTPEERADVHRKLDEMRREPIPAQ